MFRPYVTNGTYRFETLSLFSPEYKSTSEIVPDANLNWIINKEMAITDLYSTIKLDGLDEFTPYYVRVTEIDKLANSTSPTIFLRTTTATAGT